MLGRALSLGIWLVVAASAVFWALKLWDSPTPIPPQAGLAGASQPRGDPARVFGAEPAANAEPENEPETAVAPSRFQLVGVVAPRQPGSAGVGMALIALDGKPAKAYWVGARVDGETVLQSVHARGAQLGPKGGPAAMRLELAALPPPATGVPVAQTASPIGVPPPPAPAAPTAAVPGWPPAVQPAPASRPAAVTLPGRQAQVPAAVPGAMPALAPGVTGSVPPRYPAPGAIGLPAGVMPGVARPGLAGQGPPPGMATPLQQELPEGETVPLERNQQR
jgi:general secretion pathway protein C